MPGRLSGTAQFVGEAGQRHGLAKALFHAELQIFADERPVDPTLVCLDYGVAIHASILCEPGVPRRAEDYATSGTYWGAGWRAGLASPAGEAGRATGSKLNHSARASSDNRRRP